MIDWSDGMVAHVVKPPWHKRPRFWLEVQAGNCQYRECMAWAYEPLWCAYAWRALARVLDLIARVLP